MHFNPLFSHFTDNLINTLLDFKNIHKKARLLKTYLNIFNIYTEKKAIS